MSTEIVRNERIETRESRRINRIYECRMVTWDLVDISGCRLISEHRTKREAVAAKAVYDAGTKPTNSSSK